MSTPHQTVSRQSHLKAILHYGKECLLNRWKTLAIIGTLFVFLPRLVSFFVFSGNTQSFVDRIRSGAMSEGNLFDRWEELVASELKGGLTLSALSLVFVLIGVLALARTAVDYFEQRPTTLVSSLQSGFRILLFKGLGAGVMMFIILMPSAVLALLRVIVLCLLVMLPVELVAGHKGGMRSVINVVFLRYVARTSRGRWPAFSNMMTIGGMSLSLVFVFQLGLLYLLDLDVAMGWKAGWWTAPAADPLGTMSRAHLIVHVLELILETAIVAATMPFAASLRYLEGREGTVITTI